MKTKEELNALKGEIEAVNRKLAELTEEELEEVSGGSLGIPSVSPDRTVCIKASSIMYGYHPIDESKPQTCGNCVNYNHGKCYSGRGHG